MKRPRSIGMEDALWERVRREAENDRRSISVFIEILIEEALAKRAPKEDSSETADKQAA